MVKSTEPAKDERRKASRNGEEVSEYLSRSDLASRMGTWSLQFDVCDKDPTCWGGVLALSWGHSSAGILQQVKGAVTVGFEGRQAEFLETGCSCC